MTAQDALFKVAEETGSELLCCVCEHTIHRSEVIRDSFILNHAHKHAMIVVFVPVQSKRN